MEYRREIDGLRAIAVLPVILFHAGFTTFSGGFIGVDVFFVISGYLITKIIASEFEEGSFSVVRFYERRARRILPALFFVLILCIPASWLWLFPSDMKDFSQGLIAVSTFSSNFLFWQQSGYFNSSSELKPLLHTWSLAVEEQYYILLPLLLMAVWNRGRLLTVQALISLFLLSFVFSVWATYTKPDAAFYLLPSRAWELLLGSLIALYRGDKKRKPVSLAFEETAGWAGIALIGYATFTYTNSTPFPGHYALAPTTGAALIILFSSQRTTVGKLLGNRIFVGVGLISYSAYLLHQPIFAFARHASLSGPSSTMLLFITLGIFPLAWASWKFIETPFRSNQIVDRNAVFVMVGMGTALLLTVGLMGHLSNGFRLRFDHIHLPSRWDPPIRCHGAAAITKHRDPITHCLGKNANGVGGDIFLIGDSHAAQITFPLKALSDELLKEFHFINTESKKDFPYAYLNQAQPKDERILSHLPNVLDEGDILVIAFHRGRLNEVRDDHLPLKTPVIETERYNLFVNNMELAVTNIIKTGAKIILVKDTPLLSNTSTIEKCAYLEIRPTNNSNHCSVSLKQDLHTRTLQAKAFDHLRNLHPDSIIVVDPLPTLYRGAAFYSPMNPDGTYRMFDRHHLTEGEAFHLTGLFRSVIR